MDSLFLATGSKVTMDGRILKSLEERERNKCWGPMVCMRDFW